jgi:hypothetical protein
MDSDSKFWLGVLTLGVILILGAFHSCNVYQKNVDSTPIVESCVKHPVARSVHVQ